jgi:hypothetical protein
MIIQTISFSVEFQGVSSASVNLIVNIGRAACSVQVIYVTLRNLTLVLLDA